MFRPVEPAAVQTAAWKTDLASRVRALRDERGLARKDLAAATGLSLRFLAEIEGGHANPSLSSLHDLARGLGVEVTALLERRRPRALSLLGLRGAGKSTVGARAAALLGWPFVEVDREVEVLAGMSLGDLFALHGEAHYRTLEHRALQMLLAKDAPAVLATGGGLVTSDLAFELVQGKSTTVWLKATPQEHWDRVVAQGDTRPMAARKQARAELEELYQERAPRYALAHAVVDTSGRGVDEVAERVAALSMPAAAAAPTLRRA